MNNKPGTISNKLISPAGRELNTSDVNNINMVQISIAGNNLNQRLYIKLGSDFSLSKVINITKPEIKKNS